MTVTFPPSIWAETAPGRPTAPPLSGPEEADVAVIGGGFTGLSTALHLARAGCSVRVVEAMAVGWGASGRNNGQVIPTLTAAEPDAMIARHGAAGERFARLVGASAGDLFALARDEAIAAEAEQTGWFQPAHSPGRIRLSARRVRAWQGLGFPAELLDATAARDLLGSDAWHGGMFNPTGGHVNPLALARGLAAAAERHGAVIHEQSPAVGCARDGAGWRVETAAGSLRSRGLVVATNAYSGEIVPGLAPRLARSVIPVLSWQMATDPLDAALRATILPGRAAVSDTRGDLRFFRYDAGNRLITGGAILGNRRVAERLQTKVARSLTEAFPALAGLTLQPCLERLYRHDLGPLSPHPPARPRRLGLDRLQRPRRRAVGGAGARACRRAHRHARGGARPAAQPAAAAVPGPAAVAPGRAVVPRLAPAQRPDRACLPAARRRDIMTDLPILERRRIEAMLLRHVFDVIAERSGRDEAEAVIGAACARSAIEQGLGFAEALGRAPDLEDFAEILPNWTREDALEIDVAEASAEKLDFNVTRCRYAEMYREMGLGDIGHLLSCNRDGSFCIGYNPDIELTRTQTIMRGADHCDFRYRMKAKTGADGA